VRASNGTLFGTSQQGGGYIVGTNVNVGSTSTSGIDLQATYTTPLENLGLNFGGDLSFNYVGSILRDFRSVPLPGQPEYDCAGLFGPTCSTVSPEYRHTFRVAYAMPNDLTISAAWRHLGEVTFEGDSGDPTLETPGKETFASQIEAYNYLDLSALWRLSDAVSLRAGVNNVLDKDPPLIRNGVAGTGQPNTFQTYDLLGRQIFVGLTLDF
jgi:outer membrane receptor protein involved in Fe transport